MLNKFNIKNLLVQYFCDFNIKLFIDDATISANCNPFHIFEKISNRDLVYIDVTAILQYRQYHISSPSLYL